MTQANDQGFREGMELMADLLERSGEKTAEINQRVIDNITRERDRAQIKYEIVYNRIVNLLSGTWMPTSQTIIDSLSVSEQEIEWELEKRQRQQQPDYYT